MSYIHDLVQSHWAMGRKTKRNNLGWIIGNSICCHHRGHRKDTRSRGNFLFADNGLIAYNCYNCGLKAKFDTTSLSDTFEQVMLWLNISREDINKVKLELLNNNLAGQSLTYLPNEVKILNEFKEIQLPDGCVPFNSITNNKTETFDQVSKYLMSRGNAILNGWEYFWCNTPKWNLNKRIIIPFYQHDKIVGWSARFAGTPPNSKTPKYFNSDLQDGYMFNCDILANPNRKFVLISEGPFDAIAVSGIATLGSELNKNQISWLNNTNAIKIVLPDRQRRNQGLIDAALANDWYVSFPEWEDSIKDAADASCKYGRLFTIKSAISSRTNSKLQIDIKRKMFRK